MPSFTIISCALAAVCNNLTPALRDSDPVTWNMEAETHQGHHPEDRAVLVVHIDGEPVDMGAVTEVAAEHDCRCGRPLRGPWVNSRGVVRVRSG